MYIYLICRLESKTTCVVIRFLHKRRGLMQVELVPRSWVWRNHRAWECRYPPVKDYHRVPDWIQCSKNPELDVWKSYAIEIVSECGTGGRYFVSVCFNEFQLLNYLNVSETYEQGMRRMQRSYYQSNVDTTSGDDKETEEKGETDSAAVLDKESAMVELDSVDELTQKEFPGKICNNYIILMFDL